MDNIPTIKTPKEMTREELVAWFKRRWDHLTGDLRSSAFTNFENGDETVMRRIYTQVYKLQRRDKATKELRNG